MKRITKANQKEFIKLATNIILSHGAKPTESRYESIEFDLPTKAGVLHITVPQDQDIVHTVFMKFKEPTRANNLFHTTGRSAANLNQYSGKYNIHHFKQVDAICSLNQHLNGLN